MASPRPRDPELGTVIAFDHFNLQVSDPVMATAFYVEGLRLTRDPYRMVGTGNMWINVGRQQIHCPTANPAPFAGEIWLLLPSLAEARERLEAVAPRLAGTKFACRESRGALAVVDPWGRRFRVHEAGALPGHLPLALPAVEFWVPPGTAPAVAAFYEDVIGAPVERGKGKTPARATVTVGPHQTFRFVEKAGAPATAHTNHVALYLTGYQEVYERMQRRKLVVEPHRNGQFRFRRLVAPRTGATVFECEHEMRSLYHRDFGRPLVNRAMADGGL